MQNTSCSNERGEFKLTLGKFLMFFIPSMIGILLFMFPVPYMDGKFVTYAEGFTIPIAVLKDYFQGLLGDLIPLLVVISIMITLILTIYTKIVKPKVILENDFLNNLLNTSAIWTTIRALGAAFVVITYAKIPGMEMIYSEDTGGLLLNGLMPTLFVIFLLAGILLPLILNFGLLEFVGVMLTKIMRPLFKLPGRSSVDCMTSWLGDGTIGVLLTNKQLESGFYTKKEAAIIATSFSAVSITFCLVVITELKLDSYFVPMIGVVAVTGIVNALIIPRIMPLSKIENTYIVENDDRDTETPPAGDTLMSYGLRRAVQRAENCKGPSAFLNEGIKTVLDMWVAVLPVVMAIGTIALIVAENTPVFGYLGMPFVPLLELLHIPEAVAMSHTIMVGFADMFLPAIIGSGIESELTRFVIACLSVSQLIYMSEVGGLILATKIPVSFTQLFIIFILRTLVSLPIIALFAHMLF